MAGKAAHIDVYARVRPVKRPSNNLEVDFANHAIGIHMDKANVRDVVNNQKENYSFAFSRILDASTTQDQVFDTIAQPVVDSVLEGYNGTIFAYGQTGSGKTFTITGGAERYADRGIIPRALSYIFAKLQAAGDTQYEVRVSYLEIYNEAGYDLLDPSHETKGLEDLPKVSLQEDHDGRIHLRNLSAQVARSEEEALNLLFVGDTNRMISETPMNMASSRSHCIFTVSIEARKEGSDVVRRSKLHLVDLAGSERVKKTGIEGTSLREARYINLSLHYLEQVIIALQEKKFVPYRNSMMTSVLRDSLGGNCKTVMVATLNNEEPYLDETVSTCRFAQRVALVKNSLEVNEEIDPKLLVGRLKAEIRELKEEIQLLRGEGYERSVDALNEEERARCEQLVSGFLREADPSAMLNPGEMAKIQLCFRLMRDRANSGSGGGGGSVGGGGGGSAGGGAEGGQESEELTRLRMQLQQRDHEINILVSMLNKHGGQAAAAQARAAIAGGGAGDHAAKAGAGGFGGVLAPANGQRMASGTCTFATGAACAPPPPPPAPTAEELAAKREKVQKQVEAVGAAGTDEANALVERNAAFEQFRRSYRKQEVIEDNKVLLKAKYDEAKKLGESVNAARAQINAFKSQIEACRRDRAISEVTAGESGGGDENMSAAQAAEEERLKMQMEEGKRTYKEGFAKLKELKAEIEHLQRLLEQSRRKLQQDFETWYSKQQAQGSLPQALGDAQQYGVTAGAPPPPNYAAPPSFASPRGSGAAAVAAARGVGASPHGTAPPGALAQAANAVNSPPVVMPTKRFSMLGAGAAPSPPQECWGSPGKDKPSMPVGPAGKAPPGGSGAPPLTGDPVADAEIQRFYEARNSLLKQRMAAGGD